MRKYQNISSTISFVMLAVSMTLLLVDFTEDMAWLERLLYLFVAFFMGIQISIQKAAERYMKQDPVYQHFSPFFVPRKGDLPDLRIDESSSQLIFFDEKSAVFFNKGHFFGCTVNDRGKHEPVVVWNQDLAPDVGLIYDDFTTFLMFRQFAIRKGDDYFLYTVKTDLVSNAKNYIPSSWFAFESDVFDKETLFTIKEKIDKESLNRICKKHTDFIAGILNK